MAYVVERELGNGYRCGCCFRSWDDTDWYDDLADALELVPLEPWTGETERAAKKPCETTAW